MAHKIGQIESYADTMTQPSDGEAVRRIGVREFRAEISKVCEGATPCVVFNHGGIVGVFVPVKVSCRSSYMDRRAEMAVFGKCVDAAMRFLRKF